jgi:hypothetical protein
MVENRDDASAGPPAVGIQVLDIIGAMKMSLKKGGASGQGKSTNPGRETSVSHYLDSLVMLLSSDWFEMAWSSIGLSVEPGAISCVKDGCREIVKDMIGEATEYYHIDFSDERCERTRRQFEQLALRCNVGNSALERMSFLADLDKSSIDMATRWLFVMITNELLRNSLPDGATPNQVVRTKVTEIASHWDTDEEDFEDLCLGSQSTWDQYLRTLSPGLPTKLPDYVSSIHATDRFEFLRARLSTMTSDQERREILGWYRRAAWLLAEREVNFPD